MNKLSLLIITVILIGGCASSPPKPPKTQLQIREFQTRTFEVGDSKIVMKAMVNVLQDDGFIVKNAVVDLGLLTASKEVNVEDPNERFIGLVFGGQEARWRKNSVVELSANVTEIKKATRVRVNFQAKTLDNRGDVINVESIDDPEFYQEFFSKVDKGIFIQRENL